MNNYRGAALMIVSMGIFAVTDMFITQASKLMPVSAILMIMGLAGTVLFAGLVMVQRQPLIPRDLFHPVIVTRNLAELTGTFGVVMALALTTLSSVSAILQALPLCITMLGALFLGEQVGWRRWSAISVGFVGMLLIVRPGTTGFEPAALYAVLGVLGLAVRDLTTRTAPTTMTSLQLAQWGYAMVFLLGLTLFQVDATPVQIPAEAAWLMAGIVVFGMLGYFLVVSALRISDLSAVAPFRYSRLVFALALAVVFLGERPDHLTLAGASLIIGSGLYTLARERAIFSRVPQG